MRTAGDEKLPDNTEFRPPSLWPLADDLRTATVETWMNKRIVGLGISAAAAFCAGSALADTDDRGPFELQPIVGYSWVNLTGFSEDQFMDAAPKLTPETAAGAASIDVNAQINSMLEAAKVPVEGQGLSAGVGAQLKFLIFVLGARYAYTNTSDFGLHTMGGDIGLRIGERVALYGRGGAGFAFLDGLPEGMNTRGFTVGLGAGLDVRPTDAISFGIGIDGDVLLLSSTQQLRSTASFVAGGSVNQNTASEIDGSALGFQIRPQIHLTWHL